MFAFLFGWLVGDSARTARDAGLPESVKQQRYDASMKRQDARRRRRSWDNPSARVAYLLLGLVFLVAIVAKALA